MGKPIPVDEWPSQTAAVLDLESQGVKPPMIAAELGMGVRQVHSLLYGRRNRLSRLKNVPIRGPISQALSQPASSRGLTAVELAYRILEICAAEPTLIDNILDDGGA